MNMIPEQKDILASVGKFVGGKVVDAAAIAAAIVILRSGVRDPKIIAGAFSVYALAKRSGQLNGQNAGTALDSYLKSEHDIDVDQFINDSIQTLNDVLNEYFVEDNALKNTQNENAKDYTFSTIDNETYTIQRGKTVWHAAQSFGTTVDELVNQNPYLRDRSNADKSYILVRPGDKLEYSYSNSSANSSFNPGQSQIRRTDPLALDLNHDRQINTSSLEDSNAYFDMDNSGTSERTGWISDGDGLLAVDENGDGKIDNINELFGNSEVEGYTELKNKFDSNGDNVIDTKDERFNELQVWIDNGDGISQTEELKTLSELNITSINLDNIDTSINSNGNEIFKTSTFTQDGNEYLSGDLNFAVNNRETNMNRYKNEEGNFESSFESFILPTLKGSGEVVDTTFAYDENSELKQLAKQMAEDEGFPRSQAPAWECI
jgi:ElaB/YqjD/DUF883 family membrane-anchored ribosome-binding protein